MNNYKEIKTVCKCKLDDGSIVEYAAAAYTFNAYDPSVFELIGAGVLYSVNDVLQNSTEREFFFKRVTP